MNGGGAEGGRQLEVEQVGLSARLRERERGARETRGEGRGGWGGSGSSKQTDRQTDARQDRISSCRAGSRSESELLGVGMG